ncbi:Nucleolar complex protein 3, partial [Perkinsus olseni]
MATKDDAHRLWPLLERLRKPSAITPNTVPVMERWLAAAADKICSNPNENIDWIQVIWAICDNSAKVDKRLSRRAVLTGVAVVKDIIPAYKSTGVGVQKTNKKLSKQAEEILTYDTKLVEAYQNLLTRLKTMREVRGMCALLECASLWTFNDFDRLLAMVVSSAAGGYTAAIRAIEGVLKDDEAVEVATKKIVIMIGKVKSPQQLVHLAPLLKLARTDTSSNIIEEQHNLSVKLASGEEDTDINRDLDAGFAGLNKERVRKAEAVVLAEVLVVYLRVLRTAHLYPKEVIVECLKGIGEKADAANLELVIEIAHELRDFFTEQLGSGSDNGPLLAAHAALALLKLAGSSAGKAIGEPVQGALATCLESLPKLLRLLLSQEDAIGLLEDLCRGVMGVDATLGG